MKVVSIVGARPQFVKSAMVSRAFARAGVKEVLVHTGQHYDTDMSDVFFSELGISKPEHNLRVGSGLHGEQTGRMLAGIEQVLLAETPDWTVVYGDTNSTLAGALAAVKLCIPVAHVEAGLRSFNWSMPEEINRILTDHSSRVLFAPTPASVRALREEGIDGTRVHLVGDVMYDAALFYGKVAESTSSILKRLALSPGGYVLATVHRAENTDSMDRIEAIWGGLQIVARSYPVVVPLHPRMTSVLARNPYLCGVNGLLQLIGPVGYLDMLMLEKNARVIVTDSGGVQKEAFFHRVPCVTLRDETEWLELVEIGCNQLVPPHDREKIASGIEAAFSRTVDPVESPYGNGHSADRIVECLVD